MPQDIKFLLGPKAAGERMVSRKPAWIVHCEVSCYAFVELDADDPDHARAIAKTWVKNGTAISAAVRRVFPDGTLGKIIGPIES
jgi:hypothetical protein